MSERKTYSLDSGLTKDFGMKALTMSDEIGMRAPKQHILDALVTLLVKDPTIYAKVREMVAKKLSDQKAKK